MFTECSVQRKKSAAICEQSSPLLLLKQYKHPADSAVRSTSVV